MEFGETQLEGMGANSEVVLKAVNVDVFHPLAVVGRLQFTSVKLKNDPGMWKTQMLYEKARVEGVWPNCVVVVGAASFALFCHALPMVARSTSRESVLTHEFEL